MTPRPALVLLALFALLPSPRSATAAEPPSRPNIVLIISDDQAWTDYGFMGHPVLRTPHLDRLAASGALFRRAYVPTALCRPSLASIVTGLFPHQHGITGNDPSPSLAPPGSPEYAGLRERLISKMDRHPTLPGLLGEVGYLSHQSGKWWEGSYRRGGFSHGMTRGFPEPGGRHGDDGLAIGRQGLQPIQDFIDHATREGRPFFVWYAPFLPHTPHNPPERFLARYRSAVPFLPIARYYAMCEWFDDTLGQLLELLDRRGLSDNTLVAYVGDNGWIQDPHGTGFAPRSKQSAHEGGIRQPILLRWPAAIRPQVRDDLVSSLDLMPTLLRAAGARVPEALPGLDLLPALRDDTPLPRDAIFGEGFAHDIADLDRPEVTLLYRWIIEGRWKLLLTHDGRLGRYAAVHPRTERGPQLFDLLTDPHEHTNLAEREPDRVARLAERIARWWPVSPTP
ncbi:MAG: sulfatase [Verrucomicrobiae bacterium]|nr:sulfatase [Verrucomicrobiae bacterium]